MRYKRLTVEHSDGQHRFLLYDLEDAAIIERCSWHLDMQPGTAYARTAINVGGGARLYRTAGQLLLGFGPWGHGRVEYINGNGMDARRENLRHGSQSEVLAKRRPVGGSSQYKGVTWDRQRNLWLATFRGRKQGRFEDEVEAALAFDLAAFRRWGLRAYFNFPEHPQLHAEYALEGDDDQLDQK